MKQIMRVYLLIAAMLWLSVSAFSQMPSENVIELKIKGVSLNSSYSTVVRQLGKPLQKDQGKSFYSDCSDSRETPLTLRYDGLKIELYGDGNGRNFRVTSIDVTSSKWSVAPEINIGAKLKDVRAKFGEPSRIENESGKQLLIYFHKGDGGAVFHFRENKLVQVSTALDLC
jgi:hypothetical protein